MNRNVEKPDSCKKRYSENKNEFEREADSEQNTYRRTQFTAPRYAISEKYCKNDFRDAEHRRRNYKQKHLRYDKKRIRRKIFQHFGNRRNKFRFISDP